MIELSPEYDAIKTFYGERTSKRSHVPLMNHINEGLAILTKIDASFDSKAAYCIHPLFQNDQDLMTVGEQFIQRYGFRRTVFLAMEYRNIANRYLAKDTKILLKLSPIKDVNDMLIADKIQNRKDFEIYHKHCHKNAERLDQYFKEWLNALSITEQQFQDLKL